MFWLWITAALLAPAAIIWIAEELPRPVLGVVVLALLVGYLYHRFALAATEEAQEEARHPGRRFYP